MGSFFPILLFSLNIVCANVIAESTRSTCNVETKSTIVKLKRELFCEYDSDVRPVQNNNNVTRVQFYLKPFFYDYTHESEKFILHTWISMSWNDSHLTWDPAAYDDIKWIPATGDQIWVPDVMIHNERIGESSSDYDSSSCWISRKGMVKWLMAAKYVSTCISDNTWWPYHTLNCTIQFGSWSHSGDEIDLVAYENMTQANVDSKHPEWNLAKLYVTKSIQRYKYNSGSTVKMFSYHFILSSHFDIIRIAYVSPTIALMVMTLMTLWLEPKSFERMMIANLNFICHLMCIQSVHWEMPKSGFNTPKMLIFYESSLGIAVFALILTSMLRHLQELTTEPPVWISAGTTSILRSRIGRILLISILDPAATAKIEADVDDNTDLVQSNSKRSPWTYITVLIGWLAFLSVLLAYIVLLSTCFPTNNTVKY
ncbi:PREDICTED: neuronal acetylcholine receptor subunit beta-3-like [Vollenhovia emeryi]|uniref:neuronal acetylcholine receptor subunit beta-3-like n=1 Tax=Vollenhovia emeryi TaxID=411798 RepID=UPI0005F544E2|nr:PREDICTED: neuronal acetylcholine receptor subunit beta-3-like [Vollenhovia emeryi]